MPTVVKIQNGRHLGFCLKFDFCRPFCLILRNIGLKERLYEVKKDFDNLKTIYNPRIHDTKKVTRSLDWEGFSSGVSRVYSLQCCRLTSFAAGSLQCNSEHSRLLDIINLLIYIETITSY